VLVLDARVAAHVQPYYEDQAAIDRARLAMLRHTIIGAPARDRLRRQSVLSVSTPHRLARRADHTCALLPRRNASYVNR
jgi:hypothetical protein